MLGSAALGPVRRRRSSGSVSRSAASGGRPLAAEIAALVVVATYLIDLLAPPLSLPDWFHQLALTAHLGQPMAGTGTRWEWRPAS